MKMRKKTTHPKPEPAFCHNTSLYQRLSHTWYTSTWRHPHVPTFLVGRYFHQSSVIPFKCEEARKKKTWTYPGDEAERKKKCEPEEKIKSLIAGIDNLFEWNIIFTESF